MCLSAHYKLKLHMTYYHDILSAVHYFSTNWIEAHHTAWSHAMLHERTFCSCYYNYTVSQKSEPP